MKKIPLFAFVLLLSYNCAFTSDSTTVKHKSIWQNIGSDFEIFVSQGLSFYSTPFRMSGKQWIYTGIGAASLGIIMTQDKNIKLQFSTGENKNSVWYYAKQYGEIKYAAAGSVLIYGTGLFVRSDEIRVTGRMLLQSLFYAGSVNLVLKTIFGRSRPYVTDNQYEFNWFESNDDYLSFPSGHATVAFAVSTVLAERIDTWWSRTFFYSIAVMTALSRVHDNMHWASDVVLGSAIGFGAGYFTVHTHDKKSGSGFSFTPSLNGINFQYSF
jgi:membrane-associated phospholipid phosphatase